MNILHPFPCICDVCAPKSSPTPSPTVKSAATAEPDVELAQMAALFKRLEPKGRALALALVVTIDRLQGKRG